MKYYTLILKNGDQIVLNGLNVLIDSMENSDLYIIDKRKKTITFKSI